MCVGVESKVRSGRVRSGHVMSGQVRSSQVRAPLRVWLAYGTVSVAVRGAKAGPFILGW